MRCARVRVRVTIELEIFATDRLTGTVTYDGQVEPVPFDGWLDLMRLLELITQFARARPPTE